MSPICIAGMFLIKANFRGKELIFCNCLVELQSYQTRDLNEIEDCWK